MQNFVSAGCRHGGGDRVHTRVLSPLVRPARQLLGGHDPVDPLRSAAAVVHLGHRAACRKGWCRPATRRKRSSWSSLTSTRRARRSPLRPYPWDRRLRRSPSSSSARTEAVSSTPTRRIPSRTPRRFPTSWRWSRSSSSRPRSATRSDAWWATRSRAGWCLRL